MGYRTGAKQMLGRPWAVKATVVPGQKLGRTLGFPTANLVLGDVIAPKQGVYAVQILKKDQVYQGVANYGRRPTVGADTPLLEAHLFDFEGDLYGQAIEVRFLKFLRDEQKFDGLEALKAQIAMDCEQARDVLGDLPGS